jgi:hypothetical protein
MSFANCTFQNNTSVPSVPTVIFASSYSRVFGTPDTPDYYARHLNGTRRATPIEDLELLGPGVAKPPRAGDVWFDLTKRVRPS